MLEKDPKSSSSQESVIQVGFSWENSTLSLPQRKAHEVEVISALRNLNVAIGSENFEVVGVQAQDRDRRSIITIKTGGGITQSLLSMLFCGAK